MAHGADDRLVPQLLAGADAAQQQTPAAHIASSDEVYRKQAATGFHERAD